MGDCVAARVGLGGLLVALFVVGVQRVVTTVYVLNFSTAGPNATILLTLFLCTGWTVLVVPALRWDRRRLAATFGLLVVASVLSTVHAPVLALVGALGMVTVVTPLVVVSLQPLRERAALAGALGVAVFLALRAWLDTAPTYATLGGRVALVALAAGAVLLWVTRLRASDGGVPAGEPAGDDPMDALAVSPVPLVAFLWLAGTYVGTPAALATWAGRSYPLTAVASVAGLLAGAMLVVRRGAPGHRETVGWLAVAVAGAAALLWTDVLVGASVLPVTLSAVLLLARGSTPAGPQATRRVAARVLGVQALALVGLFLHIGALNWAFMPAPLDQFTKGRLPVFLFGVWLLLPATVALSLVRARTEPPDDWPTDDWPTDAGVVPADDRRALLGVAATGLLGLAGLGVRESLAGVRSAGDDELRVMTYNVHQFLAPGGDYSHAAIRDVIASENPHVVGLQESESGRLTSGAHDGVRWLAHELGYHYTYGTTTGVGSYGVALLSRWPIARERVVYMPVGNSPPYPALFAELDTPRGTLPVVVTHLQTQRPGHRQPEQADLVVDLASDYDRAVVLGDFNVQPNPDEEAAYRIMSEAFTDAWTAAGSTTGSGDTYSASDPQIRIDYVWLTDDWAVTDASTVGTDAASDHRAVVATLRPRDR